MPPRLIPPRLIPEEDLVPRYEPDRGAERLYDLELYPLFVERLYLLPLLFPEDLW